MDENYLLIDYKFNEETIKSFEAIFVDVEVINKKNINQRFEETANIVYPDGDNKYNYSISNFVITMKI